ncbi:MAG TPA: ParB/RepB/Spo0J family partition protein [Usitatibacteraceae bacterium]|nr:ParB/RepB/Spo0J family partition protein [Usitatibacteraceae bacterium]
MNKARGLGRGLDALLGGGRPNKAVSEGSLREVLVGDLKPGKYQPRSHMDSAALEELAGSIRERGIVQPILVRELSPGKFEIVAGERRWRAAQMAGLVTVPALVRDIPDEHALGIGLIENIQREDLNAIEQAAGIKRLIDEFKLTHERAAQAVGRSRTAVTNLLRLLELARPVQDMVMTGKLDMGHARALLALGKAKQVELAHQVVARSLSVREAERLVARELAPHRSPKKSAQSDAEIRRLESDLSDRLSAAVKLKADKKGRGAMTISFASLDELDGILARLGIKG